MVSKRVKQQYEKLKQKLLEIDFICMGSVVKVFQECGKPYCRCHKNKKYRHGPYYFWTRKVNGKTVTRKLTPEEATQCQQYIQNYRKLQSIIKSMQKVSSLVMPWYH